MCEVSTSDDSVLFTGPELELTMAYLTVKPLAEKVEIGTEAIRASPVLPEIVNALETLCEADVSSLLLDIKESLLHLGWLVEGSKGVVRIRKSRRAGVSGFTTVEYENRTMTIVTTQKCLVDFLRQIGFEVVESKYLVEGRRRVSTLAEVVEIEERLSQATC